MDGIQKPLAGKTNRSTLVAEEQSSLNVENDQAATLEAIHSSEEPPAESPRQPQEALDTAEMVEPTFVEPTTLEKQDLLLPSLQSNLDNTANQGDDTSFWTEQPKMEQSSSDTMSAQPLRLNGGSTLEEQAGMEDEGSYDSSMTANDFLSYHAPEETEEEDFTSGGIDGRDGVPSRSAAKSIDMHSLQRSTNESVPTTKVEDVRVEVPVAVPITTNETLHHSARNVVASGKGEPRGTAKLEVPMATVMTEPTTAASCAGTIVSGNKRKAEPLVSETMLYVCEGCFKYMIHPSSYALHQVSRSLASMKRLRSQELQKQCTLRGPPGKKVYQRGAHTIWEVDGEAEKVGYDEKLSHCPITFIRMFCLAVFSKSLSVWQAVH